MLCTSMQILQKWILGSFPTVFQLQQDYMCTARHCPKRSGDLIVFQVLSLVTWIVTTVTELSAHGCNYLIYFILQRLHMKPLVSDPGMHHGTCVTKKNTRAMMHAGNAKPPWRGKRSHHSRLIRNPQYYISDKRPMEIIYDCNNVSKVSWKNISW